MAMLDVIRPHVAGAWVEGLGSGVEVAEPFSGASGVLVQTSTPEQIDEAIASATAAAEASRLTQAARSEVLHQAAALMLERRADLEDCVRLDTGFVHADVAKEVDRAAHTLQLCAHEARRLAGEAIPMEGAPGQQGITAFTRLDPLGVVCAITPFNSPLNTVVHKIGPAIAAGNAVILKPAIQTPRSADALVRILRDAGLPANLITTVYGDGSNIGHALVSDPRVDYIAFTGSTSAGRAIHQAAGMRRVQLEMGSIAGTIVDADADLERAAPLILAGAFRKSGQVCTSVQRLFVLADVVDDLVGLLHAGLEGKAWGDPRDPVSYIGPLINAAAADRVQSWIDEAVAGGAEVVFGGPRAGNVVAPTILRGVPSGARLTCEEVFGPVIVVEAVASVDEAIESINAMEFGLASGIFTRDIGVALDAADRLRTGAVYINQTSSNRVDLMPFAGVKASGFGAPEGPAYAIRDMSEQRLISFSRP